MFFVGVFGLLAVGRRLGKGLWATEAVGGGEGLGVVDGAVFGLLGLLLAFSFSGAASRFEGRRSLILAEANSVGTAWMRIGLLPEESQPRLRQLFRDYFDARLKIYRDLPDLTAVAAGLERAADLQDALWAAALEALGTEAGQRVVTPVVNALNEMFDVATARTVAATNHPPAVIFGMIAVVSLVSAVLAGYGMAGSKKRSLLHMLGFSLVLAMTVYVILDLEYPRLGVIRIDAADRVLHDTRARME
ncbi:MAG: DUF4239 domain-containing protein [Limisphaerales bacterium]